MNHLQWTLLEKQGIPAFEKGWNPFTLNSWTYYTNYLSYINFLIHFWRRNPFRPKWCFCLKERFTADGFCFTPLLPGASLLCRLPRARLCCTFSAKNNMISMPNPSPLWGIRRGLSFFEGETHSVRKKEIAFKILCHGRLLLYSFLPGVSPFGWAHVEARAIDMLHFQGENQPHSIA